MTCSKEPRLEPNLRPLQPPYMGRPPCKLSHWKVSRMKSKNNTKKGLYDILNWVESKQSHRITDFWDCVFKEHIMSEYPTLRMLRNTLMDGSFQFYVQQPERDESEETDEEKRKKLSKDEGGGKKRANSVKKKRKLRNGSVCEEEEEEEEEQAGPSSQMTPRKKSKKICFSSPLKKGENDIWNWPLYKRHLPVTCGQQEGTLDRQKLAKGEKCIAVKRQWFTPGEFQKFAGKESYKNWKFSIRCKDTPLGKLIQEGHLTAVNYKGGCKKAKKSLFPSGHLNTVSEGEEDEDEECDPDEDDQVSSSSKDSSTNDTDEEDEAEEQTEQQPDARHDRRGRVFKVTCGAVTGTLYQSPLNLHPPPGTRGKSIRTETSWMTPDEFLREASCQTDASWRKDITCDGEPLSVLIEAKTLKIHSLLCKCDLCKPDGEDLENQKNDDECFICKTALEEELVECDHCPRSFHQRCHLPHVGDDILQ
ncbi:nuclear body protein SP140-like protein [Plectropomus leopardus]|uniref:nuclear body protein SP140-like protein n=1 Tax=Plectropomus leopardus TaxID=160734 RepID=UPI001C4C43FC|nr:nuclear body protein SP140-like protein [Plectropomus leopardus]